MARIAFWDAPEDPATDKIKIRRSSSSAFSSPVDIATVDAVDYYGEWVTYYTDESASSAVWYRVDYLDEDSNVLNTGRVIAGDEVLGVSLDQVFPLIQGLPRNAVNAQLVQQYIRYVITDIESQVRMQLQSTTVVEENYSGNTADKVFSLYNRIGQMIQLRHYPIISIDKVQYRVRSTSTKVDITDQLDITVEQKDAASGYNHGQVVFFAKNLSLVIPSTSIVLYDVIRSRDIEILVDYKHGYATIPNDLQRAIAETVAGSIMEIAGESGTAGVSSQSVDGMSESFTASATTTVFSARRIFYTDTAKQIIKRYNKPFWA